MDHQGLAPSENSDSSDSSITFRSRLQVETKLFEAIFAAENFKNTNFAVEIAKLDEIIEKFTKNTNLDQKINNNNEKLKALTQIAESKLNGSSDEIVEELEEMKEEKEQKHILELPMLSD